MLVIRDVVVKGIDRGDHWVQISRVHHVDQIGHGKIDAGKVIGLHVQVLVEVLRDRGLSRLLLDLHKLIRLLRGVLVVVLLLEVRWCAGIRPVLLLLRRASPRDQRAQMGSHARHPAAIIHSHWNLYAVGIYHPFQLLKHEFG